MDGKAQALHLMRQVEGLFKQNYSNLVIDLRDDPELESVELDVMPGSDELDNSSLGISIGYDGEIAITIHHSHSSVGNDYPAGLNAHRIVQIAENLVKRNSVDLLRKANMDPVKAFEHALLVDRVATRYAAENVAMEFPTDDARDKYLKEHPKANKSKHTVNPDKKPSRGEKAEMSEREYQKSDKYKTEKTDGYYPKKAPDGMKYPKELDSLPHDLKENVMSLTEEDLDKNRSYNHPALKKMKNGILKRLDSGKKDEVEKEFLEITKFREKLFDTEREQKNDADQDPYRFAGRKLYHAWQAYNAALQEFGRPDLRKKR